MGQTASNEATAADDEEPLDKERKPSAVKQSAISHAPVPRWFPGDGDGDAQHPGSWRYVADWDLGLNSIDKLPKHVVLSNVVAWMVWKSERYSAAEMATYWPLDFAIYRRNKTILAHARRFRGRSKIFNSEWATLPVLSGTVVKQQQVAANTTWGQDGYNFDQRNEQSAVWQTATGITRLSRAAPLFHPFAATLMEPKETFVVGSSTSKLPEMDDDTLLFTWSTHPKHHPELRAAFANNGLFLHEMEQLGPLGADEVLFCKNVGSDFGAADVMIAPRPENSLPSTVRQCLIESVQMALMACMSRGKKKLVVGGFFVGGLSMDANAILLAFPFQLACYGGKSVCPMDITAHQEEQWMTCVEGQGE